MKSFLQIIFLLFVTSLAGQQFYVSGNAAVLISDGANLQVGGELENDGSIINNGTLSLFGNWTTNNMFNGMLGNLTFSGLGNQTISLDIQTSGLTISSSGVVSYTGSVFTVIDQIDFQDGILATSGPTLFTLESGAQVSGGSGDSYFQGRLTYQGAGIRVFPVGFQGQYAPLTLLNVFGTDPEFTVFYQNPNPVTPVPGEDLLGVSHLGLWEVELTGGSLSQETPFFVDFTNENLQDFLVPNEIRHRFKSPVIAYADAQEGSFASLGVESLLNTDSLTFGMITSEMGLTPELNEPFYLALGMGPQIDPDGLFYIPQVFSPGAIDIDNQTFKVFGEKINDQNFKFEIYNGFGAIVYSTNSFIEANTLGWDGVNQKSKVDEPTGTYFYYMKLEKENGQVISQKGTLLLVR